MLDRESGTVLGRLTRYGFRVSSPAGCEFARFVDPLSWRTRLLRDALHGVADRFEIHRDGRQIATLAKEAVKFREGTRDCEERAARSWVLAICEGDSEETRKLLVSACYLAILNRSRYQGID